MLTQPAVIAKLDLYFQQAKLGFQSGKNVSSCSCRREKAGTCHLREMPAQAEFHSGSFQGKEKDRRAHLLSGPLVDRWRLLTDGTSLG